jgi:hypothetical protein
MQFDRVGPEGFVAEGVVAEDLPSLHDGAAGVVQDFPVAGVNPAA